MENQNDKESITSLVNEVKRYEIITDYFKKYPRRLTDRNKEYLEEILYRVYEVQEEQLPEHINDVCIRILKNLSTKLDLI